MKPTLALARLCSEFDRRVIDATVNGLAKGIVLLSKAEGIFDRVAVDALVNQTARTVYSVGTGAGGFRTGRLRNYLMFLAVALVGLFVGVFAWVRA